MKQDLEPKQVPYAHMFLLWEWEHQWGTQQ